MPHDLTPEEIAALARGSAVLGAGGGGDTTIGRVMATLAVQRFGPVALVDLDDLQGDGVVLPLILIGSPTVLIEKVFNGDEGLRLRDAIERVVDGQVVAIMTGEIGGANGLLPIMWAAQLGLPYADADGMGRAFPELQMTAMHVHGVSGLPCAITDARRNVIGFHTTSNEWLERLVRGALSTVGGMCAGALYPMPVALARRVTIRHSVSNAIRLGRELGTPAADPVARAVDRLGAFELLRGKVIDVERRTTGRFVHGSAIVEGMAEHTGRLLRLEIQNENLVALSEGMVLASVPDVISVLDTESGEVIGTERLRYGNRVTVIAFASEPIWRTPEGLRVVGPRAFGYGFDFVPVEELHGHAG